MKLAIRYRAAYHYAKPASLSPHSVRLFPRPDVTMSIQSIRFATNAGADIQYRRDLFDNQIAFCFYPEKVEVLEYELEIDLQLEERNAFHFLVDPRAVNLPFAYSAEERSVLDPFLHPSAAELTLPETLLPKSDPRPTVETLVGMNDWIFDNIEYERRDEGEAYPAEQTLDLQRGSCRDFSVLMAEVLRRHGLASRLVSGFVWETDDPDSPKKAENALHAWIETYLPGAGWIGLDPTNGLFCNHFFLPTAVGITPAQIAPVAGHYYGKETITSTLDTNLSIQEIKS